MKVGDMAVLETVDTNGFSPMIEQTSRGLLFQGGIESVAVIDMQHREVVARFFVDGAVHKMVIPSDDEKKLYFMT